MIKGIIFDYGGTIDSFGNHWSEVIYDGSRAVGPAVDKQEFRTSYVNVERLLARERHILPTHTFHDLMQIKIRLEIDDLVRRGILQPDAAELADAIAGYCYDYARLSVDTARPVLAALAEKFPMVLVSNFYGNVEAVLRDMEIRHYFRGIIESAVVGVRKPDPRIFEMGVIALGLKPDEVLVVGDSLRKDIYPARSLGCQTAWIKGKGWTPEEDAAQDTAQIPSLASLLDLRE